MLLIKNAKLTQKDGEKICDILIKDGKITKIQKDIKDIDCKTIDAKNKYLLPGIVDLNVNLKDSSFTLENIQRLQEKAKRSGVSSLIVRPDFKPKVENRTVLELLNEKLKDFDLDIRFAIDAIKDNELLNDIAIMLDYNNSATIAAKSFINSNLLRRILQYSLMKNKPLSITCDNPDLNDNGVMHEGKVSSKLGLFGRSAVSEISEVAKVAYMAEYYGAKTIFSSLSTAKSVELIYHLKSDGTPLYSEVSILHLIFDDTACDDFNTFAKIDPPLREQGEKENLLKMVIDDKVDIITSLHSAVSLSKKDVAFNDAEYGADVLDNYLSLSYTYLVKSGHITMHKLMQLLSYNPAKILGLNDIGEVKEGFRANLMLFDPKQMISIDDKNSLLHNQRLFGRVTDTIYNGRLLK